VKAIDPVEPSLLFLSRPLEMVTRPPAETAKCWVVRPNSAIQRCIHAGAATLPAICEFQDVTFHSCRRDAYDKHSPATVVRWLDVTKQFSCNQQWIGP